MLSFSLALVLVFRLFTKISVNIQHLYILTPTPRQQSFLLHMPCFCSRYPLSPPSLLLSFLCYLMIFYYSPFLGGCTSWHVSHLLPPYSYHPLSPTPAALLLNLYPRTLFFICYFSVTYSYICYTLIIQPTRKTKRRFLGIWRDL